MPCKDSDQNAPAHPCKLIKVHCLPEDTLFPLATYSALQRLIRLHLHFCVSWSRFTVCLKTLCILWTLQCPAKTLMRLYLHIRVSWSMLTVFLMTLWILGYLQCPAKTDQAASAHPCQLINIHCLPEDTLYPWLPTVSCKDSDQTATAHLCRLINIQCLPEDTLYHLYPWLPTVPCKD